MNLFDIRIYSAKKLGICYFSGDYFIEPYLSNTISKVCVSSVFTWMLIAAFVAIITYVLYRNQKLKAAASIAIPVLAFYLAFVVTITLIERVVSANPTYNLTVFWTYKAISEGRSDLIMEIVWNIVLFIPIGFLINFIIPIKYFWVSVISGLLLSAGIETLQLVLHRGFFEFDDMIHNTLGAILGIVVFALVSLVWKGLISVSSRHL